MAQFCAASRQKINLDKSKAFFSRNVHFNRMVGLRQVLGIGITGDLGTYLGVLLIHSKITKATFSHIVQKVKHWPLYMEMQILNHGKKISVDQIYY